MWWLDMRWRQSRRRGWTTHARSRAESGHKATARHPQVGTGVPFAAVETEAAAPHPTRLRVTHFVLIWAVTVAVAYPAIGARATYGAQVTSDEPQYLTTALSLAEDFDLDISDELEARAFLPYHEINLDPQTIDLNADGQRISPHDPLLPLLLAPAMGLGGWTWAKVMLSALAGLTAVTTAWVANRRMGIGSAAAGLVTTAMFATPPLTAYATQVYPEMPAALSVTLALAGLLGLGHDPDTRRRLALQGLVVAMVIALPWLSVKYVPVAGVLAVALLVEQYRGPGAAAVDGPQRRALVIGGVLALAGVVYLVVHRRVYGGWTVYASGDHFVDGEFLVVGDNPNYPARTIRLIGLLIDRGFGLIPWSPAFLLLVPALAALARRADQARLLLFGVLATGWGVATWVALTMHGWWWPGRQLVVVLPVAVLALAALADGRPRVLVATVTGAVLGSVGWLWLVYESSTDQRTLIVDFHETRALPYRLVAPLFPDHMVGGTADQILTVLWTVLAIGVAYVVWRRSPGAASTRADAASTRAGTASTRADAALD